MTYTVQYTDKTKQPIIIEDEDIFEALGISLPGKNRIAYGQELQENLLHLMENFACPEDPNNPDNPDITQVYNGILSNPTEGHLWYNSTKKTLNWYDGAFWNPVANRDDMAANWGVIADGQQIPKPVSVISGKVFDYTDCVWIVSPYQLPTLTQGFNCTADDNAVVSMKYTSSGTQISGNANYMIVGLSGHRAQRLETINYTLVNASTGVPLTSSTVVLAAQCIPALQDSLAGMHCDGTTAACASGNCAPRTGINFGIQLSGGVAPYTVKLVNISRTGASTECVSFGYDNVSPKVNTNSASTTASANLGAMTYANTYGPLSILSDCGTVSTSVTGVLTLVATDAVGNSRNIYVNYSSQRLYPTNPVNDAPFNTDVCGNGTTAAALAAIGSPNLLYVQSNLLSAPANTAYAMTRAFTVATPGTYTMKIFNDDNALVYVDGTLIYSSTTRLPCNGAGPNVITFNMLAGTRQVVVEYENVPNQSPSYAVFSIYDPNGNIWYTSNKSGWLALTATTGITS